MRYGQRREKLQEGGERVGKVHQAEGTPGARGEGYEMRSGGQQSQTAHGGGTGGVRAFTERD